MLNLGPRPLLALYIRCLALIELGSGLGDICGMGYRLATGFSSSVPQPLAQAIGLAILLPLLSWLAWKADRAADGLLPEEAQPSVSALACLAAGTWLGVETLVVFQRQLPYLFYVRSGDTGPSLGQLWFALAASAAKMGAAALFLFLGARSARRSLKPAGSLNAAPFQDLPLATQHSEAPAALLALGGLILLALGVIIGLQLRTSSPAPAVAAAQGLPAPNALPAASSQGVLAQPERSVAFTLTLSGVGQATLAQPQGLCVSVDGKVFVADLGHNRVAEFSHEGALLKVFGGPDKLKGHPQPFEFSEPSGLALSPDGHLLVADAWNQRIEIFSQAPAHSGDYGLPDCSFYSPRNVAVDPLGNAYVADTGNSQIKVVAPDGKVSKVIGSRGRDAGEFLEVFGLALNSHGELFTADPVNGRLQKFGALPAADLQASVTVPGWLEARPHWPQVAVDKSDRVFVSDTSHAKIWVYDRSLRYLGTLVLSQSPVHFVAQGLAFAPDGSLWVSDANNNQLLRLTGIVVNEAAEGAGRPLSPPAAGPAGS